MLRVGAQVGQIHRFASASAPAAIRSLGCRGRRYRSKHERMTETVTAPRSVQGVTIRAYRPADHNACRAPVGRAHRTPARALRRGAAGPGDRRRVRGVPDPAQPLRPVGGGPRRPGCRRLHRSDARRARRRGGPGRGDRIRCGARGSDGPCWPGSPTRHGGAGCDRLQSRRRRGTRPRSGPCTRPDSTRSRRSRCRSRWRAAAAARRRRTTLDLYDLRFRDLSP